MLILLALLGCTDAYPTASTTTDTSSEMEMDTGSDSDTDTGADDTAVDSGSDDTSGDTAVDDSDTGSDTGADTEDSGSDTAEDTATDSGSDVDSGTDSGTEEDSGSDGCTDADSDGYCSEASGGSDCDDFAGAVNPGQAEVPDNGVDEDCDGDVETTEPVEDTGSEDTGSADTDTGSVDTGTADTGSEDTGSGDTAEDTGTADTDTGTEDTGTAYVDADSDGYGSTASGGDDCDDANSGISPGAIEIADDGIDQDCSGADSVTPEADVDGDGYGVSEDCDDADASVYPGAADECDDGIDQDCDGVDGSIDDLETWYLDSDADTYGSDSATPVADTCGPRSGYVSGNDDCDDSDASININAAETLDDGVDQDCDGVDSTLATLQDEAMCAGSSQEACVVDVDGDGIIETLLMDDSQWTSSSRYGDEAQIVEYGSCAINGDTVSTNSVGYYVIDFTGLSTCTAQMSLVQSSYAYWWQNLSFCTDGSDTQGICENMGGANYLIGLDWDSSDGFQL